MGYVDVTDDIIDIAFGKFKVLADKKKHVYDEDIAALVDDSLIKEDNVIKLKIFKSLCWYWRATKSSNEIRSYGRC